MTTRSVLITILICLCGTQAFSQSLNTAKLDSLFQILSDSDKVMGSVAIAKNGKMVYRHSIGYADAERQTQKANDSTRYRIGSITKMFTATMIFQLIDEGKLSLSTPLSAFFTDIPNSKEITIALLLNHRSGLYDFVNDAKDKTWITQLHTQKVIIDMITKGKTHAQPDAKFSYSNSGYFLLAAIIEKITQQTYNVNLQNRICTKLDLKNTYSPADNVLKDNEANSYSHESGKWKEVTDIYFPNVVGVGDILSTPTDLITFDEGLLNGKLVSNASLKLMRTMDSSGFGMGMQRIPFYKTKGYGHSGDTYGTHSVVAYFRNDSLTIASCYNGEAYPHNAITVGILNICYNMEYKIPDLKTITVDKAILEKYTGSYASKDIPLKINITQKGDTLYAQATNQPKLKLDATEETKFKFDAAGIILEFDTSKSEMVLKQHGATFVFTKEK